MDIYLKGRKIPIRIKDGRYLGHTRPDGTETENWHYYEDETHRYHFRKTEIQAVIEEKA